MCPLDFIKSSPNNCIFHLKILYYKNFKDRIDRNSLPVTSNRIKLHLLLFYPSAWYIRDFFLFHIEIEGKCGSIIERAKGYVASLSQIIGGAWAPLPLPPLFLRLCIRRVIPYFDTTCPLLNTVPDPASV